MTAPAPLARRRRGTGALMVIALILAASGALRLGTGVGEALARGGDAPALSGAPLVCPPPPEAVVEALAAREARLATREGAVADRQAALALAETVIARRLTELAEAEAALSATLALADGAAEADLERLTTVYEAMKPKDASPLFAAMDPQFAAGFLGRMRPDAAAAILAGMDPAAAYTVSLLLAGRNSAAPTE
ncbi:MAG: MotE family protein [Gemmobacter sp.]